MTAKIVEASENTATVENESSSAVAKNVKNDRSHSLPRNRENDQILSRADWTDFVEIDTLARKAGVGRDDLPKVVVKELVDNALDVAGRVNCGFGDSVNTIIVKDDGPGLQLSDDEIASLYSVSRPRRSSKFFRLPSRGALGNGLRVVMGLVAASDGSIKVSTGGRTLELKVNAANGLTEIVGRELYNGTGTRIEICLGDGVDVFDDVMDWGQKAIDFANLGGKSYKSDKTSAYWFTSDSFVELMRAAGKMSVCEFVKTHLAKCSGRQQELASRFAGRTCDDLTPAECDELLTAARTPQAVVKPQSLGRIGKQGSLGLHAIQSGTFSIKPAKGRHSATIPYVVEVWAIRSHEPALEFLLNRTPITADCFPYRVAEPKTSYKLQIGDNHLTVKVGKKDYAIHVNLIVPYIPLLSDGKSPDLSAIERQVEAVIQKAVARANAVSRVDRKVNQGDVVRAALEVAIGIVSDNGLYRYSLRQLFYTIRPSLIRACGKEPKYGTFGRIIAEIERDQGCALKGIYRDNRGSLYIPHIGEIISIGTRSVENYRRQGWTFSKILYSEKEGLFPALIDSKWPERHDCALLSGQGFASGPIKDLIDYLAETGEPITVFCIHDADAAGTTIYDTLQNETLARAARKIQIINLGLEPAEGRAMGLEVEKVERAKKKRKQKGDKSEWRVRPTGSHVSPEDHEWLQTNRIELNAMTTTKFIAWLDGKMKQHGDEKLIAPPAVCDDYLRERLEAGIREQLIEAAIKAYDVDAKLKSKLDHADTAARVSATHLQDIIRARFAQDRSISWRKPVDDVASKIVIERMAA